MNEIKSIYQIDGGTLPLTAETYVKRRADDDLYEFAKSTERRNRVCSVLAPRQMGKSSLMTKVGQQLVDEGLIAAQVNLQALSGVDSAATLWSSLLDEICQEIDRILQEFYEKTKGSSQQVSIPSVKLADIQGIFWQKHDNVTPALRFKKFLLNEVIPRVNERELIVFLDEIQELTKWNLQHQFIPYIKALSDNQANVSLQKLKFVLLGVARPSDLDSNFNVGKQIELTPLIEDLQPLWKGLQNVPVKSNTVLEEIIYWTGGKPYLTQLVCHLVVVNSSKISGTNPEKFKDFIKQIVDENIIQNWRKQDKQNHFLNTEIHLIKNIPRLEVLNALNVYEQIINQGSILFESENDAHWDLIISGLVTNDGNFLKVANQIYERIFTQGWLKEKKEDLGKVKEYIMPEDPLSTIYNRDVYMLLDFSASMSIEDAVGGMRRWHSLRELIIAHVNKIIKQKVCSSILAYIFGKNAIFEPKKFSSAGDVRNLFIEKNEPEFQYTFVVPTLKNCLNSWFDSRNNSQTQGAFFVIYTDGQFDDTSKFEELVKSTCLKIDDARIIKIIVIGIGRDIDQAYFEQLNKNAKNNVDKNNNPCDIVDFEWWAKYDDGESDPPSIIELMEREIAGRDI